MTEARQNTVVGFFALLGIGIVGVLVFIFGGGRSLFTSSYDVSVFFPKGVVGVQTGQGVTLNGKRVGETTAVEFPRDPESGVAHPERGINVVVSVDEQYDLPAASRVIVITSVMGFGRPSIQFVVSDPHDRARLPKDGSARIDGQMVPILDQLLPKHMQATLEKATRDIGELAAAMKPAVENLTLLLESRNVEKVDMQQATANLATVIQRFDATLKHVNEVLGDPDNQANLSATLANMRAMSESGVTLMQNLGEMSVGGKEVVANVNVLAQRLITAADDMSGVLMRMDHSLVLINEGEGTAGLMLRDNRLYEELVLTTRRMTQTLDEFREAIDLLKKGKLRLF